MNNNRNPSSAYLYAILTDNEASKWSQWYLNGERFRAGNNRKSVTSWLLTVTPSLEGFRLFNTFGILGTIYSRKRYIHFLFDPE
jgi:hypothetical protein